MRRIVGAIPFTVAVLLWTCGANVSADFRSAGAGVAGEDVARIPPLAEAALEEITVTGNAPDEVRVRVVAYNVEKGSRGSPEEIAALFMKFNPDLVGFSEAPGGDWTLRAGEVLGMNYAYLGKIASAHHKDKYKSILSRTPLSNQQEFELNVKRGWNPASAVRAETQIQGIPVTFYTLHIARSGKTDGHAWQFVDQVLSQDPSQRILVVGDFNNEVGHPAMDTFEEAGMRPVWRDLEIDLRRTTSVVKRSRYGVIDHILYDKRSGARASFGAVMTLSKPLSDHKPVYAEIVFPTGQERQ